MSMLTIYLRKADGHGEQIHVDSNLSLKKLLAKVQTIFSVNSSENVQFDLIHRGTVLDSKANDSLQLAGIGNNSIIHIASREQPLPERITLRIIIEDKAYQFVLNKLETVEKLKSEVARELNLPESSITLSYMGLEMDDRQTLETHRLVEGALISANASIGDLALFTQNDRCRASLKTLRQKVQSVDDNPRWAATESKTETGDEQKANFQKEFEEDCLNLGFEAGFERQPRNSSNWFHERIIDTESVMGEEDVEEIEECHLVVNRVDNLRQYGFNCVKTNTFGDVRSRLAKFEDKNSQAIEIKFDKLIESVLKQELQQSTKENAEAHKQAFALDPYSHNVVLKAIESRCTTIVLDYEVRG